ncbi:hypothetical protein BH11PSE11_BH11PSE11_12660 [soil metagenome]
MLSRDASQKGLTIVELVIGLAIVALLIGLALPTFRVWIVNTQVRSAAEALQNGLQVARNLAVQRNTSVEFRLGTGSSWDVVMAQSGTVVQSRPKEEGSPSVAVTVLPGTATSKRMTFTSLGGLAAKNADGTDSMTRLNIAMATSDIVSANAKSLSIVATKGQIKLCDTKVTDVNDPRYCFP